MQCWNTYSCCKLIVERSLKPTLLFLQKMKRELLAKQDDFLSVAQHGALLFVVLSELHKLHPYYRYPLESFLKLFHVTIAERNRGKKSSGSPAARAAELITALSRKVFDRTSWSLFQGQYSSCRTLFCAPEESSLVGYESTMSVGIPTFFDYDLYLNLDISLTCWVCLQPATVNCKSHCPCVQCMPMLYVYVTRVARPPVASNITFPYPGYISSILFYGQRQIIEYKAALGLTDL